MIKAIAANVASFTFGYLLASSDEEGLRKAVDNFFDSYDRTKNSFRKMLYNLVDGFENVDISELRANIDKLFQIIKKRMEKLLSLDSFEDKVAYSKEQFKEISAIVVTMFWKYFNFDDKKKLESK